MRRLAAVVVCGVACGILDGYDATEYLAYPALEDMAPLPGAPLLSELGGSNWTARFHELIAANLARYPAGGSSRGPGKKFDVLFGMGLQKSGTTSFNHASRRMGFSKQPHHFDPQKGKQQTFRFDKSGCFNGVLIFFTFGIPWLIL